MPRWAAPALFALLAILAAGRAVESIAAAARDPAARAMLTALYLLLRAAVAIAFAIFVARRRGPLRHSREPAAFVACAVAMVLVLPVGGPGSGTATAMVLVGDLLALLACVWLLVSVLALGDCFGILPEARGLVVRGPYRFLRHPVYLGEIGALAGLTLAGLTLSASCALSLAVLGAFVAAQATRMRMEEAALSAAFPEYASYAARTGRLLPRLRTRLGRTRSLDLGLATPTCSSVAAGESGR